MLRSKKTFRRSKTGGSRKGNEMKPLPEKYAIFMGRLETGEKKTLAEIEQEMKDKDKDKDKDLPVLSCFAVDAKYRPRSGLLEDQQGKRLQGSSTAKPERNIKRRCPAV